MEPTQDFENQHNYPVGYIGQLDLCKKHIESLIKEDDVLILDADATIDEIKKFHIFLLHRGLNRKVGVIYGLNCWTANAQAVLLKIFEQLPPFNSVYYSASFLPSFVIVTRSRIIKLHAIVNENLQNVMRYLLNAMSEGKLTNGMLDGWKILVQTQSWVDDGLIERERANAIFKDLGA